jgi:hypothetical protein
MLGHRCPLPDAEELDDVDVVVVVLDWANAANPIAKTPTTMIARIVMIRMFRLFGRENLFPEKVGLKDNLIFSPLLLIAKQH